MRTLYNLPDGDVDDINKKVASQIFDDDQPNKSYLTISQVRSPFSFSFSSSHFTSSLGHYSSSRRMRADNQAANEKLAAADRFKNTQYS
jgi:hypothetical protein